MQQKNRLEVSQFVIIFLGILTSGIFFSALKLSPIYSATSDSVNLQGKIVRNDTGYEGLNVSAGNPACVVAGSGNDTCDFRVRYYDASSGGNLLLTEQFSNLEIGQYNGVFNLALGSDPSPTAGTRVSFNAMLYVENDIYVEIGFAPLGNNSYTETFTRLPMQSTPFAVKSKFVPWSGIQPPTTDSVVEHSTHTTAFNWATGTGTSNLFSLTSDSSSNGTGALLNIETGMSSTLTPLRVSAGGTNAILVDSGGNVGVGTSTPFGLFSVGGGGEFRVDSYGDISKIKSLSYSWPSTLPATGDTGFLRSDDAGNLNWITIDISALGGVEGTGALGQLSFWNSSSEITGDNSLFWDNTNKRLGIGTTTPDAALSVGTGSYFRVSSTGDITRINNVPYSWPSANPGTGNTRYLKNDGSGNLSWAEVVAGLTGSGTAGQVSFWSGTNSLTGDNGFFWDNVNKRLGIGTNTPSSTLEISGASEISNVLGDILVSSHTGLHFKVNSGSSAMYINSSGKVGIGTITPSSLFSVGSTSQFSVDSSGNMTRINNLAYTSWPGTHTANGYLKNDGSGGLSWTEILAVQATGTPVGSSSGGQVSFWTGTTTISGDDDFYWDNVNKRLGIGTNTPQSSLDIASTGGGGGIISNSSGNITIIPAQNLIISQGDVGIGTSSPLAKLHVVGSSMILRNSADQEVYFSMDSGSTAAQNTTLRFGDRGSTVFSLQKTNTNAFQLYDHSNVASRFLVGAGGNSDIELRTIGTGQFKFINDTTTLASISSSGNATFNGTVYANMFSSNSPLKFGISGTEVGRFDDSGRLGIGTTSPGEKLTVNGNISLTGVIKGDDVSFSAYNSTQQSISHGTSKVLFDREQFDTKNYYDTSNSKFTPAIPGKYILTTALALEGVPAGKSIQTTIYKNGDAAASSSRVATGATLTVRAVVSKVLDADGDDYFDVYCYQDTGSSKNTAKDINNTSFTGARIAGADLGEYYPTTDPDLNEGDIVVVDKNQEASVTKSNSAYQKPMGVVSTYPAVILGNKSGSGNDVIVALAGKVPVKVTDINGPVKKGDSIVLSDISGIGMTQTKAGNTVAQAMGEFDPTKGTCTLVDSLEKINWEPNSIFGDSPNCFTLPDGTNVGMVLGFIDLNFYDPNLNYTSAGEDDSMLDNLLTRVENLEILHNSMSQAVSLYSIFNVQKNNMLQIGSNLTPMTNGSFTLGTNSTRWSGIYASGTITLGQGGNSGGIKYDTETKELQFSNDGTTWVPLGSRSNTITLSAQYPGSILTTNGTNNIGDMTTGVEEASMAHMNYYQWESNKPTLQSSDIRVRYTLPSNFDSWSNDAIKLSYVTETNSVDNSKVDIQIFGQNTPTQKVEVLNKVSTTSEVWQSTVINGSQLDTCSEAGDTCIFIIRTHSKDSNYVRVGDIKLNYNRKL